MNYKHCFLAITSLILGSCGPTQGEVQVVQTQQVVVVQQQQQIALPEGPEEPAPVKVGKALTPVNECVNGPVDADTTQGLDIVQLDMSYNHSCALVSDGTIRCWGDNHYSSLGDGSTASKRSPIAVNGIDNAEEICTGYMLSCARLSNGTVKCWGNNSANQSQGKSSRSSISRQPMKISKISNATELSCGAQHACVRKRDGSVWCWGKGMPGYGKSGRIRLAGKAKHVQAGTGGTCVLLQNGQVYCWSDESDPAPQKVEGFSGPVQQLAVGERFNCALLEGGLVSCWGEGYNGELGIGEPAESETPRVIPQLYGVVKIRAEENYACAQTANGELKCWGEMPKATKYRVKTIKALSPTKVEPLAPVIEFGLGKRHYCAQTGKRIVCCAGDNRSGQLGTNKRESEEFPTLMAW